MAQTLALTIGPFTYEWSIENADAQQVLDSYKASMPPGSTNQDVADLIAAGFIESFVGQEFNLRVDAAKAAAAAAESPITVTPV